MKKNVLIVSGIFILIFGLALTTSWRFQNWEKGSRQKGSWSLDLDFKQLKEFSLFGKGETKEFINADGEFKIEYPADWATAEEKESLRGLVPENLKEKYNLEALVFAAKMQDIFTQLIVYRGNFNLTMPEIVDEMQKINREQGRTMELISSDFQEKEGIFEAKYSSLTEEAIRSKGKILAGKGNGVYLILGYAPEKNWATFKEELDKILDSAIIERNGGVS